MKQLFLTLIALVSINYSAAQTSIGLLYGTGTDNINGSYGIELKTDTFGFFFTRGAYVDNQVFTEDVITTLSKNLPLTIGGNYKRFGLTLPPLAIKNSPIEFDLGVGATVQDITVLKNSVVKEMQDNLPFEIIGINFKPKESKTYFSVKSIGQFLSDIPSVTFGVHYIL